MADAPQYPYGPQFQDKVLALMIREPEFLPAHAGIIQPNYFDSDIHSSMARILLDYYEERGYPPVADTVNMLITNYIEAHKVESSQGHLLRDLVPALQKVDLANRVDIIEAVSNFGRSKQLEQLCFQLTQRLAKGEKPDDIWEHIDRSRTTGSAIGDIGMYLADALPGAPELVHADNLYSDIGKISTYIGRLDKQFNNGMGRKELGVIMGYTGFGKSLMLVNLGAAALFQKLGVVHLSIGELEEIDLLARYAARIAETSIKDLARLEQVSVALYQRRIAEIIQLYGGRGYAKYFSPGTKVATLRSYLSRLRSEKHFEPHLLVIDNADDLRPSSAAFQAESSYEHLGQVFIELKALAHDFNVAIWCDSQTNRSGNKTDVADLDVIADSHKKARKADIVISVNQSKRERELSVLRLALVKARRYSRADSIIWCRVDYERMLVKECERPPDEILKAPVGAPIPPEFLPNFHH